MTLTMQKHETWTEYVERILGGVSRKDAAQQAGVSEATMSRWITGTGKKRPVAESVVEFARAFNQEPVKALIAAGYLQPDDLNGKVIEVYQSRAELSDGELIAELADRLAARPAPGDADGTQARLTPSDDAG